jgi:serine/threonine protein kinase
MRTANGSAPDPSDPERDPEASEQRLAEALEEFHRRRARGEEVAAEDFRERLGVLFPEFVHLLAAESALDEAMTPPVATELPATFGEYTLLREIGRGAVGVVYEAIQRGLGRKVALKVLRTGFDTDPRARERFAREGRVCAQIRHENVVTLYAYGEVDGRPYYAMTLVDGPSLSDLIRAGRAPKGRDLYLGLAGIADALHVVHEAGIVHRDVKPSNIVVEPSGRMILTDFGLARSSLSTSLTATGEALGTPLYMSPEALLGRREQVDRRTDVYGLGATLYEAIAGRPPFRSDDLGELMRMVTQQRPQPLREVASDATTAAERVARKALEKRPAERYPTALAMRSDLLALAEGRAVSGRPVSAFRHLLRERRAVWVPAAAVLLLTLGAWLWMSNRPGTIRLDAWPDNTEVWFAGARLGVVPWKEERPPGDYEYELRAADFETLRVPVSLAAAGHFGDSFELPALTPEAEERVRDQKRRRAGIRVRKPGVLRSVGGEVDLVWPREKVRLADLTTYRIWSDLGFEPGEAVLFFAVGAKTLHEEPLGSASEDIVKPIPDEVRAALRAGDQVTWGLRGRYKKVIRTAHFDVVPEPPGLAGALERADQWTAREKDGALRAELRAHAYLANGLGVAALRELAAHAPERTPAPTLGLAIARLQVLDALDLLDTGANLGADGGRHAAEADVARFPKDKVDAFYANHPPP